MAEQSKYIQLGFSEHTDRFLKPTEDWQRTGKVAIGEAGFGCGVKCAYCNQQSLDVTENGREAGIISGLVDGAVSVNTRLMIGPKIDKFVSVDSALQLLSQSPLYNPESSVLLENFNDPGVSWPQTITMMRRLNGEIGHKGPIAFITKMPIRPEHVEAMRMVQQEGAKIIGIVTYSGLPRAIEPVDPRHRIETMRKLHDAGIPVIMSMRPMIKGINATYENIAQVFRDVGVQNLNAVTIGGLFVYHPDTIETFNKIGYPLPAEYTETDYSVAKILLPEIPILIRQVARDMGLDVSINNHTSCAISDIATRVYGKDTYDRMAHWSGHEGVRFDSYCAGFCHPAQMQVCKEKSQEPIDVVITQAQAKLDQLGYSHLKIISSKVHKGRLLVEGGSLLFEETLAIKAAAGFHVDNLPTYDGLIHRTKQAFEEDLGVDFASYFAGAVQVGEEWHIFLSDVIDGKDNQLAVKWIRSRNRARIKVHQFSELTNSDGRKSMVDNFFSLSYGLQTLESLSDELEKIYRNFTA